MAPDFCQGALASGTAGLRPSKDVSRIFRAAIARKPPSDHLQRDFAESPCYFEQQIWLATSEAGVTGVADEK